jgi:hypothetical protein
VCVAGIAQTSADSSVTSCGRGSKRRSGGFGREQASDFIDFHDFTFEEQPDDGVKRRTVLAEDL